MFRSSIGKIKAVCVGAMIVAQGSFAFAGGGSTASCFVKAGGQVQGSNPDQPVRLASVMKLMTTFWALEKLGGPNYRWKTRIFVQQSNGEVHIEGSRDPFFHRDRIYFLISDLNRMGIKKINRLTADRNFKLDSGLVEASHGNAINEDHRNGSIINIDASTLKESFNTASWWNLRKRTYAQVRAENAQQNLPASIEMSVDSADVVPGNPLAGKPGVKVYEVRSAPLRYYLKRMNIASINPMADELFHSLGGADGFRDFLQRNYGMGDEAKHVYTGSGLQLNGPRRDTTMTCSAVVRIIRRMDLNLEQKYGMDLADVAMVAGVDTLDGPTFKQGGGALIVKTGTLVAGGYQAKNLAGAYSTTQGDVYFGIFTQGRSASAGNRATFLQRLMAKYSKKPLSRKPFNFDSLDNEMHLRAAGAPAPAPATPAAPKPAPVKEEPEIVVTARRLSAKPKFQLVAKPVAKTVVKPAAKPVAKAPAKPAAKPVAKAPAKPAAVKRKVASVAKK